MPMLRAGHDPHPTTRLPPTRRTETRRSVGAFFLLVVLLSLPLWVVSQLTGLALIPGLPISALQALCPAIAASIVVGWNSGRGDVAGLLRRSFDYHRVRNRVWFLPALLLMPAIMFVSWVILAFSGTALPAPQFSILGECTIVAAFFIGAQGEEIGWSGYAIEPIQGWWGPALAGLAMGAFWAGWHVIPDLQAGRGMIWVFWQFVGTVALRVIMVWLYNNSGKSVFLVVMFHMMINISEFPFSNYGPYYNPVVPGLILVGLAVVLAVWFSQGTSPRWPNSKNLAALASA